MGQHEQEGNHQDPEAAIISEGHNSLSESNQEANRSKEDSKPRKKKVEESPRSLNWRGVDSIPLTHSPPNPEKTQVNAKQKPIPKLIHACLHRIPMQVRFGIYGTLSSVLFLKMYSVSVYYLEYKYVPSTIYAGVYLIFIPMQHAMAALIVFGWPERYIPSLMSNVPIGLTAIALGAYLTAYLDQIGFNESVEDMVRSYDLMKWIPEAANNGEFYSSMFVLAVTSFWTFVLTVLVNSPTETSEKKLL